MASRKKNPDGASTAGLRGRILTRGQPWTTEEVKQLFNAAYPRASPNVNQLAAELGRSTASCASNLQSMRAAIEDLVATWGKTTKGTCIKTEDTSKKRKREQTDDNWSKAETKGNEDGKPKAEEVEAA